MTEPLEQFRMEANFEGLIQLLAQNLYAEPDVFVRELIQNAHDSIVRRCEEEPDLAGQIAIACDAAARTITFSDNGIGMDQQDIKQFLAVIGSTGTGASRQQLREQGRQAAYQLIGQFGIGMLSAFVVAEKVIVRTRKLGQDAAFAWYNAGSTDCLLYADDKPAVGADIVVLVNPAYSFMLDPDRLRSAIRRYCDFIPFPITLNGAGPVNAMHAPWHQDDWDSATAKEAAHRQFIAQRYNDLPLDVIPISISAPFVAHGTLYIANRQILDSDASGTVDIFVRRMFIRADDATLLPSWARFVRGIIDSPDLQPTAARDNIQRAQPAFEFLREQLGALIVARLTYLARHQPTTFRYINHWHHYHLKGMAWSYDAFFEQVADLLLFETNRGMLSLREYLEYWPDEPHITSRKPLYYFAYDGSAAQFYRLADARGWVVINAGRMFEEELLEKYARLNPGKVRLERLDATDDPALFQRLVPAELARFQPLARDVEQQLHRIGLSNVRVRMRAFVPPDLPAIILLTPESEAEQKLKESLSNPWMAEAMAEIAREALAERQQQPLHLLLNATHPLVQRLAELDRREGLIQDLLGGIYNSALLYAHRLLSNENATVIHSQFVRMLNQVLVYHEAIQVLQQALEEERSRKVVDPYRKVDSA